MELLRLGRWTAAQKACQATYIRAGHQARAAELLRATGPEHLKPKLQSGRPQDSCGSPKLAPEDTDI